VRLVLRRCWLDAAPALDFINGVEREFGRPIRLAGSGFVRQRDADAKASVQSMPSFFNL
jgi:hypothetical protein